MLQLLPARSDSGGRSTQPHPHPHPPAGATSGEMALSRRRQRELHPPLRQSWCFLSLVSAQTQNQTEILRVCENSQFLGGCSDLLWKASVWPIRVCSSCFCRSFHIQMFFMHGVGSCTNEHLWYIFLLVWWGMPDIGEETRVGYCVGWGFPVWEICIFVLL